VRSTGRPVASTPAASAAAETSKLRAASVPERGPRPQQQLLTRLARRRPVGADGSGQQDLLATGEVPRQVEGDVGGPTPTPARLSWAWRSWAAATSSGDGSPWSWPPCPWSLLWSCPWSWPPSSRAVRSPRCRASPPRLHVLGVARQQLQYMGDDVHDVCRLSTAPFGLPGHTQHVQAEVATPDSEGIATAREEGGPRPRARPQQRPRARGHDHGEPSPEEVAAAQERQAQDSLAGVGVGPSDVTLDWRGTSPVASRSCWPLPSAPTGRRRASRVRSCCWGPVAPSPGRSAARSSTSPRPPMPPACSPLDVRCCAPTTTTRVGGGLPGAVPAAPAARRLAATPIALWLLRWGKDLGYETVLVESGRTG